MKYLKRYKLFESIDFDIVNDCKDILLDLNDMNIETECLYDSSRVTTDNGISYSDKITYIAIIIQRNVEQQALKWMDIDDIFNHILEYLDNKGYMLCAVNLNNNLFVSTPKYPSKSIDYINSIRSTQIRFYNTTLEFLINH